MSLGFSLSPFLLVVVLPLLLLLLPLLLLLQGGDLPCPLDANSRFTAEVTDFVGRYVKEADPDICDLLKANGRLVSKGAIKHSYPFCWRSDTPLIYRAVPSWFVNVVSVKEDLMKNNDKTYWVPAFVKEKRFHNWLRDARDWNVSRNRYWGTPLPIWTSEDYEEIVVIGSIAELEELTGEKVTDLHRESIDHLTIPSKQGKGVLRRVDEVFDCWFESGSMPYAQQHYPFENKEKFEGGFPADFIAEGLDQTRGWFYTLMVLSTILFNKPAFKNLIVNGLVLAEDGKKMSKRLKNYPPPTEVVDECGADALRLYLINSPVVRAEPFRFKKEGVQMVVRSISLPWFNAYRFFVQNAKRMELNTGVAFVRDAALAKGSENVMDKWILASLHGLVKFVREEMEAYRLYTVVPRLVAFIEQLCNWFVRFNRLRLKGAGTTPADQRTALATLYEVLATLCRLMAPFMPFITEYMYQNLRRCDPRLSSGGGGLEEEEEKKGADGAAGGDEFMTGGQAVAGVAGNESVHFLGVPTFDASMLDAGTEEAMGYLIQVIDLGRIIRERRNRKTKFPVRNVNIVHKDPAVRARIEVLASYIKDEINALGLTTSGPSEVIKVTVEPNRRALGKRLGRAFNKDLQAAIAALTADQIAEFEAKKALAVGGVELVEGDLDVVQEFVGDKKRYEAASTAAGDLVVVMDMDMDEEIEALRAVREVSGKIQSLRKDGGFVIGQPADAFVRVAGKPGKAFDAAVAAIGGYAKTIQASLQATAFVFAQDGAAAAAAAAAGGAGGAVAAAAAAGGGAGAAPAHAQVLAEATVELGKGVVIEACIALPSVALCPHDAFAKQVNLKSGLQGDEAAQFAAQARVFVTSMSPDSLPKVRGLWPVAGGERGMFAVLCAWCAFCYDCVVLLAVIFELFLTPALLFPPPPPPPPPPLITIIIPVPSRLLYVLVMIGWRPRVHHWWQGFHSAPQGALLDEALGRTRKIPQ